MSLFKGAGVALITPFNEDNSVNYEMLRTLVKRQIDGGTDAIIVCGTTGEPATMTEEEKLSVIKCVVDETAGQIPVIAGTGANCTQNVIDFSQKAEKLGVDGLLVVTPYYNKATQSGLIRHYQAILDACPLPMILYNVPGRTGMGFSADTVARLSRHPAIAGLKEASGNPVFTSEILEKTHGELPVYCGNDDQILPLMSLGSCGAISVVSNILPEKTRALTHACLKHRMGEAQQLQLELMPLIRALFLQVSPIPVKAALSMMDVVHDELRLPLTPMEDSYRSQLKQALIDARLLSS